MRPAISRLSASSVSAPLDAASSGSSREAAASRFESHPGCPRSLVGAGAEGAGVAAGRDPVADEAGHGGAEAAPGSGLARTGRSARPTGSRSWARRPLRRRAPARIRAASATTSGTFSAARGNGFSKTRARCRRCGCAHAVRRRRRSRPTPTPARQAPSARGSDRKRPAASLRRFRLSPAADRARRGAVPAASDRVRAEPGSPCPSLRRPTDGSGRRRVRARWSAACWSVRGSFAASARFARAPWPPCREWFRIGRRPRSTRPLWRMRARR